MEKFVYIYSLKFHHTQKANNMQEVQGLGVSEEAKDCSDMVSIRVKNTSSEWVNGVQLFFEPTTLYFKSSAIELFSEAGVLSYEEEVVRLYKHVIFTVLETQVERISPKKGDNPQWPLTVALVRDNCGFYQGRTLIALKNPYITSDIPYSSQGYELIAHGISSPNGGIVASIPPNSEWVIRLIGNPRKVE